MILCQCTGVTDATVYQLIREGACSVADIARCCGAGRTCAPCREAIVTMLGQVGASTCPSTERREEACLNR